MEIRTYCCIDLWEIWWSVWDDIRENRGHMIGGSLIENKQPITVDDIFLREAAWQEEAIYGDYDQVSNLLIF